MIVFRLDKNPVQSPEYPYLNNKRINPAERIGESIRPNDQPSRLTCGFFFRTILDVALACWEHGHESNVWSLQYLHAYNLEGTWATANFTLASVLLSGTLTDQEQNKCWKLYWTGYEETAQFKFKNSPQAICEILFYGKAQLLNDADNNQPYKTKASQMLEALRTPPFYSNPINTPRTS